MTKRHQQLLLIPDATKIGHVTNIKGEFTIVVGPLPNTDTGIDAPDSLIYKEFCYLTDTKGEDRRAAISTLAKKYGRTARNVYAVVERLKTEPIIR